MLQQLGHRRSDPIGLRQINGSSRHRNTFGAELSSQLLQLISASGGEQQVPAPLSQKLSCASTNASARTRD